MQKISKCLSMVHRKERHLAQRTPATKAPVLIMGLLLLVAATGVAQTNNFFGTSGNLSGNAWSTNAAGPFTAALVTSGGAILNFNNPGSATGASIPATVAINFGAPVTWTAGGTIGASGIKLPINVAAGIEQDFGTTQNFSSAATAAISKEGAGSLALSGGTYAGGFTLNAGTVIVRGVNALGNGPLVLNGGILASNGSRNLSGKYSGISIGGNVQFGQVSALGSNTANLTFDSDIALSTPGPILSMGNAGTTTFNGIISGNGGISFADNADGTGIFDITNPANILNGAVSILGAQVRFAADGSFGNASNGIIIDGGRLLCASSLAMIGNTRIIRLGSKPGTAIDVAGSTLTIDAVVTDLTSAGGFTKTGTGVLVLSNANTTTGTTTVNAGILQLNRPGGATLLNTAANHVVVTAGTLQVSQDQTFNNLSLQGGNLVIEDDVTVVIDGILDYYQAANISLAGMGTGKLTYGSSGTLKYSGNAPKTVTAVEWPAINGPVHVNCDNSGGVTLPSALIKRVIRGSLVLTSGSFTIGENVLLELDGASVINIEGFIAGNAITGSASDLTVKGNTGGDVLLATSGNIGLRNITVSGSRVVSLNGINHLYLSGNLSIAPDAAFDNGGDSQLINGGNGSVEISGTFITRDREGFTGVNASIPAIVPALHAGSVVAYSKAGDQSVSIRNDYKNLRFSGGGIKQQATANSITPINGTVTIEEATILDVGNNVFGSSLTNLVMTSGRLRLSGTGTKPEMDGSFNLSGNSVIEFYNSGTVSNETIKGKNRLGADIRYNLVEVTGNKVGNSGSNINLGNEGIFIIKDGGIFEINDNSIRAAPATNGQSVVIENNGTLLCGNNEGFNGFTASFTANSSIHSNISSVVLGNTSTVNYARPGDQPITFANGIVYGNLVLSGSGVKTAPAGTLTVKGNLENYGSVFNANSGTILLSGGTQSFAGLLYHTLRLDNAGIKTLTGNAAVSDSLCIGNLLTDPRTTLALQNNFLTLRSAATGTACLGTMGASAEISYGEFGRFVVERYFSPRRAWRLVTAPITADAGRSVFSSWQMGGAVTSGSGTFVSGPSAPAGGLDLSPLNNYSLKLFDGTQLNGVDDTRAIILSGTTGTPGRPDNYGMFLFVRGDRSTTDLFYPPVANETTLRDTGKLQIKTEVFNLSGPANGYSLVGNPYASSVNMNEVMSSGTGIDRSTYYMYDPYLNTDQGGYLTYTADINGVFSSTPPSPSGQTTSLQSGQAFYVQRTATTATLTFTENNKTGTSSSALFRPVNTVSSFDVTLYLSDQALLADGIKARFNPGPEKKGTVKFQNIKEGLALFRNGQLFAVEDRGPVLTADTLFLHLAHMAARNYEFHFDPQNLDSGLIALLEDSYSAVTMPVSISSASLYRFAVNDAPLSYAPHRFRLVFRRRELEPLGFIDIHARQQGSGILVEWSMKQQGIVERYEIERSNGTSNFSRIHELLISPRVVPPDTFRFLDAQAVAGVNCYRVTGYNSNNQRAVSKVIKVNLSGYPGTISVYPNPVSNGLLVVELRHMKSGIYRCKLINTRGQVTFTQLFFHLPAGNTGRLTLPINTATGIYQLQLTAPDSRTYTRKVIVR